MIIRKVFSLSGVIHYLKNELLISITLTLLVVLLNYYNILKLYLPFSIAAILGSGLAIFIAFRNNSSYSRWWEARTLWGNIINSSRVFARLIITFTNSHSNSPNYNKEKSDSFIKEMILLQIAWVNALRILLRQLNDYSSLIKYMSEVDFQKMSSKNQKVNYLQQLIGEKIYLAMSSGILAGFDSFQLEGQLLNLANSQGGCERIKNTPLLRQYHFFTKLFLFVFMLILPISLVGDFEKSGNILLTIPISILISFVFSVMGKVGEVNEDPFENQITDVPLDSICNTIERDLLEMINDDDIPNKLIEKNGFLS